MPSNLWIPPSALDMERELQAAFSEQEEKLRAMNDRHSWLRYFNQQLQSLDPLLELVKATENSTDVALRPGYWHIKRNNRNEMPTYYVIEGPDGQFIDPHMGMLNELRKWDTSRPGWFEERAREKQRIQDRREAAAREERVGMMAEKIYSMETPTVSMAGKWSNSTKGKRGRK